jgi:hypothetical protein
MHGIARTGKLVGQPKPAARVSSRCLPGEQVGVSQFARAMLEAFIANSVGTSLVL